MRYRVSSGLWGLFFVFLGIVIAGNALGFFDVSLFFAGWWTLFIIIPCGINMISNGFGSVSTIGFILGVMLLLNCQGIIIDGTIRRLLIPIVLILIGLNMVFRNAFRSNKKVKKEIPSNCSFAATFSGNYVQYANRPFDGAELNSIFGGVRLDLRDAIIEENVSIDATAVFGGITIYVPEHVKVKVSSTSFFGGVTNSNKKKVVEGSPIIYLSATCMFGGVDIK